MPNRRQAIIWTNADPIHWRIYVALEGDKLTMKGHLSWKTSLYSGYFIQVSLCNGWLSLKSFLTQKSHIHRLQFHWRTECVRKGPHCAINLISILHAFAHLPHRTPGWCPPLTHGQDTGTADGISTSSQLSHHQIQPITLQYISENV